MKKLAYGIGILLALVVLVPFIGPSIGLAQYQSLAEPPGEAVTVEAGALNTYQHRGNGRDVVVLHGHPGSARMMKPLAEALNALGYNVLRYDRMGWGYSEQRPDETPVNPTAHARDLVQLVEAAGLQQPLFVGYSYGGGVVMEANRLAPEVVKDIALVSSVGRRGPQVSPSLLSRVMGSPLFLRWAFGLDATTRGAAATLSAALMAPEVAPEGELEALLATLSLPGVPTAWQRERDERYIHFERYQPEAVSGCVLVLHGDQDAVVPADIAEYVAEHIEGSRLTILPDAGHGMVLSQPDALAMLIQNHQQECTHG